MELNAVEDTEIDDMVAKAMQPDHAVDVSRNSSDIYEHRVDDEASDDSDEDIDAFEAEPQWPAARQHLAAQALEMLRAVNVRNSPPEVVYMVTKMYKVIKNHGVKRKQRTINHLFRRQRTATASTGTNESS